MADYVAKAGGYNWKQELVALIRSEQTEVETIVALSKVASTVETVRILNGLLAGKTERIVKLYELHSFRDD
ncbi:MAG: hypothetical protein KJZ86_24115 [Caldilineaceae bacterium]|nr:hypothetical protein [Caldilineaceae bacterium]